MTPSLPLDSRGGRLPNDQNVRPGDRSGLWLHALGITLVTAALFPLGAWRVLNSVRRIPEGRNTVLLGRDYPGAIAWLNLGGALFLSLLGVALLLMLLGRWRTLRPFVVAACGLLALQGLALAGATTTIIAQRPVRTTGGWRPAAVVSGTEVTVIPTANRGAAIFGASAIVEWDELAVREATGESAPQRSEVGFDPWLRRFRVEEAFDPMRNVEGFASYRDCWHDPHSTFDAPHEAEPTSKFEMIPHLLIIRYGPGRTGVRWAGEFRRIGHPASKRS